MFLLLFVLWAWFLCTIWCISFRPRLLSCVWSGLLQDSGNGKTSKRSSDFLKIFLVIGSFPRRVQSRRYRLWGRCWYSTHGCKFNGNICSKTKWQWIQKDRFGLNRGCYPFQWKSNSAKAHCADNCWKTALRGRRKWRWPGKSGVNLWSTLLQQN